MNCLYELSAYIYETYWVRPNLFDCNLLSILKKRCHVIESQYPGGDMSAAPTVYTNIPPNFQFLPPVSCNPKTWPHLAMLAPAAAYKPVALTGPCRVGGQSAKLYKDNFSPGPATLFAQRLVYAQYVHKVWRIFLSTELPSFYARIYPPCFHPIYPYVVVVL